MASGNDLLTRVVVSEGANDWNSALLYAAAKGVPSAVEYLIDQGATNWTEAMQIAMDRGMKHTAMLLAEKCGIPFWQQLPEFDGLFSMLD